MRRPRRSRVETTKAANKRAIEALKLRLSGKLLKQIAPQLGGVSVSRASQLIERGRKLLDPTRGNN